MANFNEVVRWAAKYLGGVGGTAYVRKVIAPITSATSTTLWAPAAGKRVILMGYVFQLTAQAFTFHLERTTGSTVLSIEYEGQGATSQLVTVVPGPIDLIDADDILTVETSGTPGELNIEAWGFELIGDA